MVRLLAFSLPSPAVIVGWVIFGGVATIALGYAKLREAWQPAAIGVTMAVFPYFFPGGPVFWTLGIGLTALLIGTRRWY